jgi:hypothetical protein
MSMLTTKCYDPIPHCRKDCHQNGLSKRDHQGLSAQFQPPTRANGGDVEGAIVERQVLCWACKRTPWFSGETLKKLSSTVTGLCVGGGWNGAHVGSPTHVVFPDEWMGGSTMEGGGPVFCHLCPQHEGPFESWSFGSSFGSSFRNLRAPRSVCVGGDFYHARVGGVCRPDHGSNHPSQFREGGCPLAGPMEPFPAPMGAFACVRIRAELQLHVLHFGGLLMPVLCVFFLSATAFPCLCIFCTQKTQHEVNEHEPSSSWAAGGSFRKALCLLDWEKEN